MVKVSLIIPVYNMERYLSQCMDSVIGQDLAELEIICIDDGSTDSSPDILESYQERDSRIRIIKKKNAGVACARNDGIREAIGEYVAFMDPDDWYPSDKVLSCLYQKAIENEVVVAGGSLISNVNGEDQTEYVGSESKYFFSKNEMVNYEEFQYDYGYIRFIYRRDFLIENSIIFPSYSRFQDPPFFVKCMIVAGRFYSVSIPSYVYRRNDYRVNWTKEKARDLLLGIKDNLIMSSQAGLAELHGLTVQRLDFDYFTCFWDFLINQDEEILDLWNQTEQSIDRELLSEYQKGNIDRLAVNGYRDLLRNVLLHRENLSSTIHELDQRINVQDTLIKELRKVIDLRDNEIKNIYNSKTYKIGNFLTRIPIKIKRMVKKR